MDAVIVAATGYLSRNLAACLAAVLSTGFVQCTFWRSHRPVRHTFWLSLAAIQLSLRSLAETLAFWASLARSFAAAPAGAAAE